MDEVTRLRQEILDKVGEYCRLAHPEGAALGAFQAGSRVPYAGRLYGQEEMRNLVDSALEFWLTYGHYSREFEERLGKFLGVKHTLLVNSGSSANLLAIMALTSPRLGERRLRRGDEVITVACGFPTTVAPIIQYGAVPVFVDVEPTTANIDPTQLEKALSPKSRAVVLAHTLGNPFPLREVQEFCRRHGLWLIEDNCDALGSRYNGAYTGTFGDIATSSFYPPHHLTMGEGGAVYTNNGELQRILASLRDWGRDCWCQPGVDGTCGQRFCRKFGELPLGYDHKYVYSHFGYNLKATDMQAAVGCAQLTRLPEFIIRRQENYNYLRQRLEHLPQIAIQEPLPESQPSWFGFLFTLTDHAQVTRNYLAKFLEERGIQTRNLFGGNLLKHPCFQELVAGKDYRVIGDSLPGTDLLMERALWVGVYPGLDTPRLDYMAEAIIAGLK